MSNFLLRLDEDISERLKQYCTENFIVKNKLINKLIKEFLDNTEQIKSEFDKQLREE